MSSNQPGSDAQALPQVQLGKKFWLYVGIAALVIVLLQVKSLGEWWNLLFFEPMLNSLLFLYRLLFRNFALSIVVFTILVKLLTLPFTAKQMKTTQATQQIQSQLEALKKKYGNDKEKINQETVKLYQEAGISPTGCLGPMLIQFPIWIGMYQSILHIVGGNPSQLFALGKHIYPIFPQLSQLVPFESRFLWVNLAAPDPIFILPILVVITMWAQQKMTVSPSTDPQQKQMNQSMQVMMPLMFGFFMYTAPAGVALYFVISNITSMIQQYYTTGWGDLLPRRAKAQAQPVQAAAKELPDTSSKGRTDGSKRRKKKR